MIEHYDVLVLGSGNAGLAAAGAAQAAGRRTAVVEAGDAGGVCATRGCVPKKVLVAAAQSLDAIARASSHQIAVGAPELDWTALIDRKETFVDGVPSEFEASLEGRGIDFVRGKARFIGPNRVTVGSSTLSADKIVVATGSVPRPLPIPGAEHLITSDELLNTRALPESVAFVGAGVIAFEFAHVLARAGTEVTLLEVAPRVLPAIDAEAADQILDATRKLGVRVETGVSVDRISASRGRRCIQYRTADDADREINVGLAVNGAGRIANLAGLDLHAAGITVDRGRVQLDAFLRSAENEAVYFAGDAITGRPQLSPLATYEGRIVGHNLIDDHPEPAVYGHQPAAIYTVPAVATVGLTEEEARREYENVECFVNDLRDWRSSRTHAESTAWAKVLVDRDTDRILGAHLVGHGAEETIHTFALAIEKGITASEIRGRVYAYPTFHSDIKYLVG